MTDERRPCGCFIEYHLADCPILTERHEPEPPEPADFTDPDPFAGNRDGRGIPHGMMDEDPMGTEW